MLISAVAAGFSIASLIRAFTASRSGLMLRAIALIALSVLRFWLIIPFFRHSSLQFSVNNIQRAAAMRKTN